MIAVKKPFLLKWAFPYAVVSGIAGWQFRGELTGEKPNFLAAVLVTTAMFVILFFVVRRQNKEQPDEVLDGGAFVRVCYGDETENIAISNLRAVETSKFVRLTRVALLLRNPSKFGDVISFYPLQEKELSGENAVAARLRRRFAQQSVQPDRREDAAPG